jgi:hypothetical protein
VPAQDRSHAGPSAGRQPRFIVTTTLDAFEENVRFHARTYTHHFPRDGV